jgi:hypothetical protein
MVSIIEYPLGRPREATSAETLIQDEELREDTKEEVQLVFQPMPKPWNFPASLRK